MSPKLAQKVREAPESPGVYIYRGIDGTVLYVGKAKNLRNRLGSYLVSGLAPKTQALMDKAVDVETFTVGSETEALILELSLVQKHAPKYNIRLRDDKHFPYIKVPVGDQWPRVSIVRRRQKDGARYFGPYTRAGSVRETLSLLRRVFPYRNCSDRVLAQTARPCLDYHIGRCLGPCAGKVDRDTYATMIGEVVRFLEGRHKEVRSRLEERMSAHAEALEFEKAARARDQIRALDDITEKQNVEVPDWKDRDVIGLDRSEDAAFVALLQVRDGRLTGKEGLGLQGAADETDGAILAAFVTQYYLDADLIPDEIVVAEKIPDADEIEALLTETRKAARSPRRGAVRFRIPKRGSVKDLLTMAEDNARNMMAEHIPKEKREAEANRKAMEDLMVALELPSMPNRIEGFDISNIGGTEAVASMVVISEGRPAKSGYRKFRMRVRDKPDDYAMMQEVLWRRFRRGLAEREKVAQTGKVGKFAAFPDLVVVDGGKGQVSAAKEVLDELGLGIPLAGLAEKNEEVFLPGRSDPVSLPRDSGALFLVMRLRDEAHRFALSYHRGLRAKRAVHSALLDIPGVGPQKARELLTVFADIPAIKEASVEEVAKVKGIGTALAHRIKSILDTRQ